MTDFRKFLFKGIIILSVLFLRQSLFAQTTYVYFVGNSFTATFDVPTVFKNLSASGGHTVQFGQDVIGGASLSDHWTAGTAQAAIAAGNYGYVVLQEASTMPYTPAEEADFNIYAPLYNTVSTNSGAQTVLYMTWVRETQLASLTNSIAIYRNMAAQLGCKLSPVGEAWRRLLVQKPSLDPFSADRHHQSEAGTYLAACNFYGAIFNESPEGLSMKTVGGLTLDAGDAALLQRIAWDAVQFVSYTNPPVISSLTVDQAVRTNSTPFTFQASASDNGSITNYLWNFGDGTTTNGAALTNVVHTYTNDGVFAVTVKVTDNSGETERTGLSVTRDTTGPQISSVAAARTTLTVTFNQDIQQGGAETATNYALSHGLSVISATRTASNVVQLTVSTLAAGVEYTLTVNNLYNTLGMKIYPNTTKSFTYIDGSNMHLRFDFGSTNYPTLGNWNNVTSLVVGVEITNAIDIYGVPRNITLGISARNNAAYSTGSIASNLYPATAQRDCIYSSAKPFSYTIGGADPAAQYRLTFFASKSAAARETLFIVGSSNVVLDTAYNTNRTAVFEGVKSDASGTIVFTVTTNVVNSSGYAYLSVMELEDTTPVVRNIEINTNSLNITEGSTSNFQVRLSSQPVGSVTVNVTHVSGSAHVQVLSQSSFVYFAATNWNVWQPVYVETFSDVDTSNDVATIQCADVGSTYTSTNVTAAQIDTTVLSNAAPVAANQSITLLQDTSTNLVLTATDADSTNLTYTVLTGPSSGSLSGLNTNSGAVTYTPATNYTGADSFTFRAFDGSLYATGTVSITVTASTAEQVVTFTINGSGDDAAAVTNATGELASVMYWPYTTTARMSFLRWQLTIPRGAVITEAHVKVRSNGTAGNTNSSVIRLEVLDTNNAPLFTSSDNPFYDAVMTNYVDSTVPGAWSVGIWSTSDDIKSLVQAYIDRPDYVYGNYIGLRGSFVSGAYKGADTWNYGDHSGAPQLEVHYTGGEVMLDLWMADPETRLGQKVYCQIINRSPTDTLRVKLDGTIIHTKAAPLSESEEIFTADYRSLEAGSHTLLVEILDAGGAVRTSASRTWTKLHEGIAKVAINENNAICRNGVPFFPITPWGIGAGAFPTWEGQINALTGQSWGIAKNLTGWETFLQSIQAYDYPVMGPAFGDYWPGGYTDNDVDIDGVHVYFKELDMNRVTEYINASKNDPSMLAYVWHDEPDLGGPDQYIPATEVRRWTEKVHEMDTEHPHYLNLVGYPFTHENPYPNYNNLEAQSYCFLFNDQWSTPMGTNQPFAKKTLVADILAFDYYPYDLALSAAYSNWIGLADLTLAIDRLREWNYNLAPTMTWIETCDIMTNAPNHVAPTPTELNNLIWLSIIHQVKGIQWFHYFEPTPAENRAVMQTATEWITSLTQPILSAPENVTWTVTNQGIGGGRVDFMTRQYNDRLYIFSTSIPTNGILTNGMATASVRFDMPGLTNGAKVGVLGEGRIITAAAGCFEDSFSPLAVHIYTYPALTNLPPAAKAGRDLLIPDSDRNGSEIVTLADAGSFDPDGTITSYVWMEGATQIATGATAQVSLNNGTYMITLVVTDNGGSTGSSTISVTVNPPPTAHAGADQQVNDTDNDGFALITLNGSASTDDQPFASYAWIEGGNVVATGMTAQVSLFAATHNITLEVTDSHGQTDSDAVQIIVVNPNVVNAQYQIAATGDDTLAYTNASGYLSATMYFPYSSTTRLVFLRWPLNIPAGATILSADLQVKSAGTKGDENPSTLGIRLIDSNSAPSFVANPYYLPVTATTEDWTLEGAWVTNQWYRSGNIKTLVQEFIDRSGYVSGSYLGLRCAHLSGNWKEAYQWDNGTHADGAILQVTYLPVTDSDADGLPDSWETLYFGNTTNAVASALAANGVNTLYEAYIAGLNPTNPFSTLTVAGQSASAQTVLQWGSVSGRVYSVYWTTNLLNGFQSLETNILWPQNSWTDVVHGAQNEGFYRIKVQLGQ